MSLRSSFSDRFCERRFGFGSFNDHLNIFFSHCLTSMCFVFELKRFVRRLKFSPDLIFVVQVTVVALREAGEVFNHGEFCETGECFEASRR